MGVVLFLVFVLVVLCFFLSLLVIRKKRNNNFMDLSPFVFTRNIPPYSPSSGLCVCDCPDCLIPPFPCTDTGPCPLICPECFCHWCHGCPSCLDCPMPFPCPWWHGYSGNLIQKKKIIILWICHLLFLQEIFHHIVLVLVFVSVVVPIVLFLRFLVLILVLILLLFLSVFVTGVLVGGVMAAPHVLIVLCLFLVLVGLAILVINPKEKNNNFMDLSPFVFTRNISPYSPSSGLCVCGCPDCLIPPFPRTDTGPCLLICPECFYHWCPGCPSCLDCPMPFPCPCWPGYSGN